MLEPLLLPPFFRTRRALLASLIVAGVVVVLLAWLIAWESRYECVRWSTRINIDEYGVSQTRVCAETRPRWGENVGK